MKYKVVQYDLSRGTVTLESRLNEMASKGWELITVTSHNIFIFAQPTDSQKKGG